MQDDELLERYVGGQISETERETVEEHYFHCERCHQHVQALRALREELEAAATTEQAAPRMPVRWFYWLIPAAAALAICISVWLLRPPAPTGPKVPLQTRVTEDTKLKELARVEAPAYHRLLMRSSSDEADNRFRAAMKAYEKKDYAAAASGLRAAYRLAPRRADILFFLGASELLLGDTQAALRELQQTIALGDTPFLEEAHFFLAKAYLHRADARPAMAELNRVVELRGERATEAEQLLQRLRALDPGLR